MPHINNFEIPEYRNGQSVIAQEYPIQSSIRACVRLIQMESCARDTVVLFDRKLTSGSIPQFNNAQVFS